MTCFCVPARTQRCTGEGEFVSPSMGRAYQTPTAASKGFCPFTSTGRVECRGDRFRPIAYFVSALSSVVAKGIRPSTSFSPPPLFTPYGESFPSRAGSQPGHPASFRNPLGLRLTQELPFTRFWPLRIQASGTAAVPTGLQNNSILSDI